MTRPRSTLVSLEATPYYHCIARCVRRAFFFGIDDKGRDLGYRKPWFLERLKLLAEVFAIDIPAYAVMGNHYHLVLHIDRARTKSWSRDDVIHRWRRLYRGPDIVRRYVAGQSLPDTELAQLDGIVEAWRERLCNISWFMSCLNHYIALQANREDGCTGHFWEGRFISQALLDETALLSCMAYVDLNPVRAGMADCPEESDFTSIQARLRQLASDNPGREPSLPLMPFADSRTSGTASPFLPYGLKQYLELVEWTGKITKEVASVPGESARPALVASLSLSRLQWQSLQREISKEAATMLNGLDRAVTFGSGIRNKIAA